MTDAGTAWPGMQTTVLRSYPFGIYLAKDHPLLEGGFSPEKLRAISYLTTERPGALLGEGRRQARPIGVMKMIDGGVADDKIIAIHEDDPQYNCYHHINELPPHTLKTLQRFFEDYKILEHKEVRIESFLGPEDARRILNQALDMYQAEKEHLTGYRPRK